MSALDDVLTTVDVIDGLCARIAELERQLEAGRELYAGADLLRREAEARLERVEFVLKGERDHRDKAEAEVARLRTVLTPSQRKRYDTQREGGE